MRVTAVMRGPRYMWLAWAVGLLTLERTSFGSVNCEASEQLRIQFPSARRLMPLVAALLLVVPSRRTAQAQEAPQGSGRHVVGVVCPKAQHEHHQPVEMEEAGSPAQHAPPFGPTGLGR